jgi:hypothetical protein
MEIQDLELMSRHKNWILMGKYVSVAAPPAMEKYSPAMPMELAPGKLLHIPTGLLQAPISTVHRAT